MPAYLQKQEAMGWFNMPMSKERVKQEKLITGTLGSIGLSIAGVLTGANPNAIQYPATLVKDMLKGDLRVSKGPNSTSFNNTVLDLVQRSIEAGDKRGSITNKAYDFDESKKGSDLPVRLSLGQFSYSTTAEGIQVYDIFDFDGNISGGGLASVPGVKQSIKLVTDLMRLKSVELGFNQVQEMVNRETKKSTYMDLKSPEMSMQSPDSTPKEGIKKALEGNKSVVGFSKEIKYTIPWNDVPQALQQSLGITITPGSPSTTPAPSKLGPMFTRPEPDTPAAKQAQADWRKHQKIKKEKEKEGQKK